MPEIPGGGLVDAEAAEPDAVPSGPMPASVISVDRLTAHPGNVREDLDLSPQFVASVAELGVRIPLLVAPHADGGYLVIEGHRRLAAAVRAGLAEVPCVLDADRAADEAGQFLDMVVANSGDHRKNFAPVEEAVALFAAHEAGANRTRIRRATGRRADEVKTALQAGRVSAGTRERMGGLAGQLTLDQLALLGEFEGDDDAVAKIVEAFRHGYTAEYVAERIRQDRAEAAEHQRLRAELEAAGTPVTDDLPAGAGRLGSLTHDGDDLTSEAHATCPGRGVYFPSWSLTHPVHYCASPEEYGHAYRSSLLSPSTHGAGDETDGPSPLPEPPGEPVPGHDPHRRLVIEGNKAWAAAAEVRKRWVRQLMARRSAPPEVARFVTGQLLTMPEPLRLGLATAHVKDLFSDVTGQEADKALDSCGTCPPGRLPLLMLAPIAVAYEGEMCGSDASRRGTWRSDRYSPCPRADAGRYLAFLASIGYPLSVIEQAVADGVPYTGDNPHISGPSQAGPPDGHGPEDHDGPGSTADDGNGEATASAGDQSQDAAPNAVS